MVKASNKAQQQRERRRLPRASASATSSNKRRKPKAAVIVGHGPHFRTPVARAYADNIKQLCLDNYNEQDIPPGKKRPPRSLESFVDYYKYDMENSWLTLEMVKGRRKNKKKSNNRKEQQKKNRKKPPPSSTNDHAPGSQELRSSLNEADAPGRPQGTNASKDADKELFIKMKNEIVSTWSDMTKRPKGVILQAYIKQVQSQYGLDPIEYPVTDGMVHSRMRRSRLEVQGVGQVSPMLAVEPRIVMFIKLSTNCNNTMNRKEIIRFSNSYIKDTAIEQEIIAWKVHHHPKWKNDFINNNVYPERAELGDSWYRGFLKRNKKDVQYKTAQNVAFNRTEHCTYEKFVEMYDNVYKLLVADGYAGTMLHPKYYDAFGKQCGKDDINKFGELVDLTFKHPELVLVADECGTNTNMSKEKLSAGNMKHASTRGVNAKIPACTSDCHFTTMVWTALTGEPVMVVVIIEKESDLTWAELHGLDVEAEWIGDDSLYNSIKYSPDSEGRLKQAMNNEVFPVALLELNTGPGKVFPGGPVCTFQGHTIPSVVRRSSSGGITPEILVEVLQHYDKHVPRKEGDPPPAAILDGHGSRLSIEFLRYVNNLDRNGDDIVGSNHKWNIYLGLPNATAYWQVGDSSQQNGAFKSLQRKVKEDIREKQRLFCENNKISRHHCVYILQAVFPDCYGNVEGNKKAILQRGWNPLNKGCLSMPEILKSKPKSPPTDVLPTFTAIATATATATVDDYNVSTGDSMHYLSILTTSNNRDKGREKQHKERMKSIKDARSDNTIRTKMISGMTKGIFTAGTCVRSGHWKLGQTPLQIVTEKNKDKTEKKHKTESKKYDSDMKQYLLGMEAIKKSLLYYTAVREEVYFIIEPKERKTIINRLKKEKKWLLSSDYKILIQFKQLSMDKHEKLPAKLEDRISHWESIYKQKPNPSMPVKPTNYIANVPEIEEEEVDDDGGVEVDVDVDDTALDYLTSVSRDLPPLATNVPTGADGSSDVANILLNIGKLNVHYM